MNDEELQADIEASLHALLCGELGEGERLAVLARVARDEQVRGKLEEMLTAQRLARSAFGYDRSQAAMRAGLAGLLAKVHEGSPGDGGWTGRPRRWLRWLRTATPLWQIAAMAAIAVSVGLAIALVRVDRPVQVGFSQAPPVPRLTDQELANLRQVWRSLLSDTGEGRPWLLLGDDAGRFGYLPAEANGAAGNQLMLVRCLLLNPDGSSVSKVNLLLPAHQDVRLDVQEIGRLAGLPLQCSIWAGGGFASVGMTVGEAGSGSAGVQGQARLGGGPEEAGEFLVNGRKLRLVLQALPMDVTAS